MDKAYFKYIDPKFGSSYIEDVLKLGHQSALTGAANAALFLCDRQSYSHIFAIKMEIEKVSEVKSYSKIWNRKEILPGKRNRGVQGYLPHKKIIYSLDTMSAECERIRRFRARRFALDTFHAHIGLPDVSLYLWKTIIAFQSYPFTTSGRGSHQGTKFTYKVSKEGKAGGRHYAGENVEGYGNELWITTLPDKVRKERSISRSTFDLALKNALTVQAQEGHHGAGCL